MDPTEMLLKTAPLYNTPRRENERRGGEGERGVR
jgi:hypothetical protein